MEIFWTAARAAWTRIFLFLILPLAPLVLIGCNMPLVGFNFATKPGEFAAQSEFDANCDNSKARTLFSNSVNSVLEAKCSSCHSSLAFRISRGADASNYTYAKNKGNRLIEVGSGRSSHPGGSVLGSSDEQSISSWLEAEQECKVKGGLGTLSVCSMATRPQVNTTPGNNSNAARNSGSGIYLRLAALFPNQTVRGDDFSLFQSKGLNQALASTERFTSVSAQIAFLAKIETLCTNAVKNHPTNDSSLFGDFKLTGETFPTNSDIADVLLMTRNIFIYPYEQSSKEFGELIGTYNATVTSVKAEGKSETEAKRIAKTTVCVAGMQSPQFWLGNSGPLDVLRKTAVEVGRRIPTPSDFSSFASSSNRQAWIKNYVKDLQASDGYQAAVKYWHQDWLGTRPYSQTMDPRTNNQNDANYAANGASRIMGSSQATFTKLLASGSPLDGQTIMGLNGKTDVVHNSEQCSKILQPFDPRTIKIVWEQKNPAVGGSFEVIASLEKRNGAWLALPGSITLNNGSKLVTGLSDINLAQTNAGTNINGGVGFRYTLGKLANSPLRIFSASDRRLRRYSPSGEQNGYSEIKTFYANQTVYACNTITRFALTCAYRPNLNAPEKPISNYTYDESKRGNSSLAAWNAEGHANINANGSYTTRVPRPLVGYHTMLDTFADPRILEQMRCGSPDLNEASYAGLSNYREDVAYPRGFDNEQSTSAPDQRELNEIAINPFYRSEFVTDGAEKLAMDKIVSDMAQDASRLIAHVVSSGIDYRQILLADYTFGTDYTKLALATQSFFLPFRVPQAELGNSPDSVKKISQASLGILNRRWFQSSQNSNSLPGSWQAFMNNPSLNRNGDLLQPKPIQGILTTAELLGPVTPGIRTVSSRIITRLSCSGVNTYAPSGSAASLHTKYVTQKTHLQTTCLSCHVNLDPLASALNVNFAANPSIGSGGALGTELDNQGGAKYGFRGVQNPGEGAFLGKPVRGLAGVAEVLANSDEFARCTVSKAFENIFGRAVPSKADCATAPDHPDCLLVEATATKFKGSLGYNYNEMIQELASSSLNLKGN